MHAVQNVELVWANVQRRLMLIRFTGPGGTIELQVSLTPAQMLADWLTEETTNRPFIAEILDEERRQYMAKQKRKIAKQRARLG
jgi:pheromone shutdown protein TraB